MERAGQWRSRGIFGDLSRPEFVLVFLALLLPVPLIVALGLQLDLPSVMEKGISSHVPEADGLELTMIGEPAVFSLRRTPEVATSTVLDHAVVTATRTAVRPDTSGRLAAASDDGVLRMAAAPVGSRGRQQVSDGSVAAVSHDGSPPGGSSPTGPAAELAAGHRPVVDVAAAGPRVAALVSSGHATRANAATMAMSVAPPATNAPAPSAEPPAVDVPLPAAGPPAGGGSPGAGPALGGVRP